MGLGMGSAIQIAQNKWFAVRKGRETGIFGTLEQAEEQVMGFQGAQMKEFDRSEPGGIDRGLLQAKMWLRSGSQPHPDASMPPPVSKTQHAEQEEPLLNLPSARRYSPMLLNALHYGFFNARFPSDRGSYTDKDTSGSGSLGREALSLATNKLSDVIAPVKRAAVKRRRSDEIDDAPTDLYARTYQDNKVGHSRRSVLQS